MHEEMSLNTKKSGQTFNDFVADLSVRSGLDDSMVRVLPSDDIAVVRTKARMQHRHNTFWRWVPVSRRASKEPEGIRE